MDRKRPKQVPASQNSVHMDVERVRELFEEMDRKGTLSPHVLRRAHVRWPLHLPAIPLRIFHASGSPVTITVASRNVSARGMSILHSSFLHVRTRVIATLPLLSGMTADLEGTVAHFSHVQGICHEMGIAFKSPVDIRTIVSLDPFEGGFVLEKVDPETLMGTILYIDDSPLGQALIRHFIRDTSLRLRVAEDFAEARKIIEEGVDLILCDYVVKGQNGAEFITSLREKDVTTPAIFITADNGETARAKFARAQAGAILTKPVYQDLLLRALAEFLLTGKGLGVTISALPENHPGTAMLDRFVSELQARVSELKKAIDDDKPDDARSVVLQIAGIAPTMGFPKLAQLAQDADRALVSTMSVGESMSKLSHLMRLCREIRTKRAA